MKNIVFILPQIIDKTELDEEFFFCKTITYLE